MTKQPKEKEPKREAGPKFKSVIPEGFRIRRTESPMARILREAEAPPEVLSPPDNLSSPDKSSPDDILSSPANLTSPDELSSGVEIVTPSRDEIAPDANLSPPVKLSPDDIDPSRWTGVPNDVLSKVRGMVKAAEWSVFTHIYRETRGYHRDECLLSKAEISRACMMSERNVPRITKKLAAKGLIEILRHDYDNPDLSKRGTWYRMLMPGAALKRNLSGGDNLSSGAKMSPHSKERKEQRNSKEGVRLSPQEIEARTALVVERLKAGEMIEAVAADLAPTMHRVDWATVQSMAQASPKR